MKLEIKFLNLYADSVKAKATFYVKTDAEGRRHCDIRRIRYPSNFCRD